MDRSNAFLLRLNILISSTFCSQQILGFDVSHRNPFRHDIQLVYRLLKAYVFSNINKHILQLVKTELNFFSRYLLSVIITKCSTYRRLNPQLQERQKTF